MRMRIHSVYVASVCEQCRDGRAGVECSRGRERACVRRPRGVEQRGQRVSAVFEAPGELRLRARATRDVPARLPP